jgi:hypothetical protein
MIEIIILRIVFLYFFNELRAFGISKIDFDIITKVLYLERI